MAQPLGCGHLPGLGLFDGGGYLLLVGLWLDVGGNADHCGQPRFPHLGADDAGHETEVQPQVTESQPPEKTERGLGSVDIYQSQMRVPTK